MTRAQARSRTRGALFPACFGIAWLAVGLAQTHHSSAATLLPLATLTLALLLVIHVLRRRSQYLPEVPELAEEKVRTQRMFTAVNIIQWVAIATAGAILGLLHMPEFIVPAVAFLVGLHLLPLAWAFQYPQYYVTGTLLMVWPLACVVVLPRSLVSGACALGTGVVLLLSVATTLARILLATRAAEVMLPAGDRSKGEALD